MGRTSLLAAGLGALVFFSLIAWLVWIGYQNAETSLKSNLNLVLRDNNFANRLAIESRVQRLRDLSFWAQNRKNLTSLRETCSVAPGDNCLAGLITSAEMATRPPKSLAFNCGQHALLRRLKKVTDRKYVIGPTIWMPSEITMAPIAHILPNGSGWLAACFEMDMIREIWRSLDLPKKSSMALVRGTDYRLWIREPFKPELLGRDLSDGPLVAAMRDHMPEEQGIADIIATKTDFVARTVEWSPIGVDDLVMVAGYPKDHFFRTWLENEGTHLITIGAFSLALISLVVFTWVIERRRFLEIEQLAGRLEITVGKLNARTTELARSNKELEQFAYAASHDLQEPLRVTSSYAQLLERNLEGRLDKKQSKYLKGVIDSAVWMHNLVSALLDFSRVSTKGQAFTLIASSDSLDQAVRNLGSLIEENGAEITRGSLPAVMADRGQLVIVFQNLISNAIRFQKDETPCIRLEGVQEGAEWRFSVADNGIGIEPQYAERIFELFQRLHTRTEYPGEGMGLSICKRIILRHGGRIWVESEVGNGSTFFFTLPTRRD